MNVGELKEMLDEYGDHVDVRVVYETDTRTTNYQIENVDFFDGDVVIEIGRPKVE